MLTRDGREKVMEACFNANKDLKREDLCMVRIEAKFEEIIVGKKRSGKPKKKRICAVTAFLRFDQHPDIDFIQVNGTPVRFLDDGDDLQMTFPKVLVGDMRTIFSEWR